MLFKRFLLLLLTLLPLITWAQEPAPNNSDLEQKIENIAEEQQAEDYDFTIITEALNNFKQRPLNLNRASREELQELTLLNDIQINNLLSHIKVNGALITIYELQSIDGFNISTIATIMPYVRVSGEGSSHYSFKEMMKNGGHQFTLRSQQIIEDQKGYSEVDTSVHPTPTRYLGGKQRLFARYKFTYSNYVSWGITGEKDAGEEFFKGSQKKRI